MSRHATHRVRASTARAARSRTRVGTLLFGALLLAGFAPALSAQATGPAPPCCNPHAAMRGGVSTSGTRHKQGLGSTTAPNAAGGWQALASMPRQLGEVSAAVIAGEVYLVGKGHPHTLRYSPGTNTWVDNLQWRPHKGDHHGAEAYAGKLYLIGGFKQSSEGSVQIYDPQTNSWTLGAPMPFAAGSVSTALIGGKIYAAGGIVGSAFTTTECAVYDPLLDSWTSLAPMPFGRNHTAAGTDGTRFWIFGGRGPGSGDTDFVANGFADVQIYDPRTDTWRHSGQAPVRLPPLPIGRGGLGKAVWLGGEFYIFGGETDDGPGATPNGVYARVDVFSPALGRWRSAAPMLTPRHGHYPLRLGGDILVPAGGVVSGGSSTDVVELYER